MIGETGERKSAVATLDGKSRKKKKKKEDTPSVGVTQDMALARNEWRRRTKDSYDIGNMPSRWAR